MGKVVIIFVDFRPDSAIGLELQSGVKCSKKNSCNYLELLLAKAAKKMHSFRFIATKSRKELQSSRFIATKSREKSQSSQFITNKSRKNVLFFFNHLDLPLAKVGLMLFCQKLSRNLIRKVKLKT